MMWQVLKRADSKSWQEQASQWLWIWMVQLSTCKKLSMNRRCAPQEFPQHYFTDLATLHRHNKTSAPWAINGFLCLSKEIVAFSFLSMFLYHCHPFVLCIAYIKLWIGKSSYILRNIIES
jgi:hypothetical protein